MTITNVFPQYILAIFAVVLVNQQTRKMIRKNGLEKNEL